jgi:hypothetical protein
LKDTTLEAVFNQIVMQNPAFTWKMEEDGLIRFLPAISRNNENYILTQRIPRYAAVGVELDEAIARLIEQAKKIEPNLKWQVPVQRASRRDKAGDPILLNVDRQHISIRQILDVLSAKLGESWVVSYIPLAKSLSVAIGSKFALPLKMADIETAKKFGLKIKPNETAIISYAKEASNQNVRNPDNLTHVNLWMKKIKQCRIVEATVPECIALLSNRLGFRCAIEGAALVHANESANKRATKSISIDVKELALIDIFDAIIAANTFYTWKIENDLVRFYPRIATTNKSYFITQKISGYQAKGVPLPKAVDLLIQKLNVLQPGIKFSNATTTVKDSFGDSVLMNADRKETTTRQILDVLSQKFKASWMITSRQNEDGIEIIMGATFPVPQSVSDKAAIEVRE